jgi:acetolactate synthase-1/2/3 large subunit
MMAPRQDSFERALALAARLLKQAQRPVCIAGRGSVWSDSSAALAALCETLPRLTVASTPGAKGVFPESHPRALGAFGFGGRRRAKEAVAEADVVLVAGSRLLEQSSGGFHARLRQGGVIRIDRNPRYARGPGHEVALTGEVRRVLERLSEKIGVPRKTPRALVAGTEPAVPQYPGPFAVEGKVKPQALMTALSRLAREVPITADAGNSMCWAIEWLERTRPRDFQASLDWGTMGFAVAAAAGICLARPGSHAIALTGDGALAMFGGELHTAVELGLPLVVVALNDGGAGMVRAGCDAWFGPGAIPSPDYQSRVDLVQYGRAFGAHAEGVSSLEEFERALPAALARRTPTLLDVRIDPSEVPAAIRERVQGLAAKAAAGGGIC